MALSLNMTQNYPNLIAKHILIVDDDARNSFALSSYLEQLDIVLHMASSGFEALDILAAGGPADLVLMDMMMPDMDGYETIRRIRLNALWHKLPVIAVTAQAMKGDREKCLAAGASGYLSKPLHMQELLALMDDLLKSE